MKPAPRFRALPLALGLLVAIIPAVTAQTTVPPSTTSTSTTSATLAPVSVPALNPFTEKLDLRLGAFVISDVNIKLRLEGPRGNGTDVDFANVLGGETSISVFRADAHWNISGAHGFDFSWYDIDLKGHRELQFDVDWGDQTYTRGAILDSRFRTRFYKFAYGYTFREGKRHQYVALIGFDIVTFETSLEAKNINRFGRFQATAPLPVVGFAWNARWTERLITRASIQYFGISLEEGKYSGRLLDGLVAVEYRIFKYGGLGGGYNRFDLNGDFKAGPFTLSAQYTYDGALAYIFMRF